MFLMAGRKRYSFRTETSNDNRWGMGHQRCRLTPPSLHQRLQRRGESWRSIRILCGSRGVGLLGRGCGIVVGWVGMGQDSWEPEF